MVSYFLPWGGAVSQEEAGTCNETLCFVFLSSHCYKRLKYPTLGEGGAAEQSSICLLGSSSGTRGGLEAKLSHMVRVAP